MMTILLGTPWYVFAIFIYLLVIGLKATKPQEVPILHLAIAPVVFITWSLYMLSYRYNAEVIIFSTWTLALTLGMALGFMFHHGSRIIKEKHSVHLSGSWIPLTLYMSFFLLKYAIGFLYATHPELHTNTAEHATSMQTIMWAIDVISSGIVSGIILGRFGHIVSKYKRVMREQL